MRRRREINYDEENTSRWLVSYADLMTLLLAFFVVMYSISSVNLGKYRVLSDSMSTAFSAPTPDPDIKLSAQLGISVQRAPISIGVENQPGFKVVKETLAVIESELKDWINEGQIAVRGNEKWLEVEISSSILFASGRAQLSAEATLVLAALAEIFKATENPLYVSGYTDNLPISTLQYPSNWELSAARSANVVRLMAQLGIDPRRLGAIGFAEYRPVVDNDTLENRRKNRRVIIRMLAGEDLFSTTTPFADNKLTDAKKESKETLSAAANTHVVPVIQVNELQAGEPARALE
jgi:chemotaxis protein MotB